MLYIYDEIDKLDDGYVSFCTSYLTEERRNKVYSYRFEIDRCLSAVAFMLLRFAVNEEYGINEPFEFSYGKYGKPFLRDYPFIHFNLSHCRKAVACVISITETGVDVQNITPVTNEMAKRVLNAAEYMSFMASQNPYELFCRYWTIKESLLKGIGIGLVNDLADVSALKPLDITLFKGDGYICCVSGSSNMPIKKLQAPPKF